MKRNNSYPNKKTEDDAPPSEYQILHELTPLGEKDALYIADRHKSEFTYPIHNHDVYELNFVENAPGLVRVVGDSRETIGQFDLVLITSDKLEHVWEQGECKSHDMREITIQFKFGLDDDDTFFSKTPFLPIRRMLEEGRKGLAFSARTIMKVYTRLDTLSAETDSFQALMQFVSILHDLALADDTKSLASSSFAKVEVSDDSRQILKVKNYIAENYMYELSLEILASVASMSKSGFSRFFKIHTGRRLTDYITEVRIGNAARQLIDTDESICNISFNVGYFNLSNFNRTFRRLKGCTPTDFRKNYMKKKIIF